MQVDTEECKRIQEELGQQEKSLQATRARLEEVRAAAATGKRQKGADGEPTLPAAAGAEAQAALKRAEAEEKARAAKELLEGAEAAAKLAAGVPATVSG